jgi:hypothetical protein
VNTIPTSRRALRVACALALLAGASAEGQVATPGRPGTQPAAPIRVAPALTSSGAVQAVPQPAAPATVTPGVAGVGTPSPSGLPSPLPSPGGVTSQFPAGLPSPTVPNLASPGTPAGSPPADTETVPPTSVMGAAGFGVPTARASPGAGGGTYTALQLAQSFLGADANRDGELTRAEAQRLTIMPYSFEEMDRNHDGILTRFEYEDGVRG